MKKYLLGLSLIVSFVYFVGCAGEEEIATPNARIVSIINNGGGVRFEWDAVADAEGYRVYVDGNLAYEGTNTFYEHTQPAQVIRIVAYSGDKESAPKTFDFTPVLTSNLNVWDALDPDTSHPSYIVFSNGTANAVNASQKGSAWLLFYNDSLRTNYHNNPNVDAAFSAISGTFENANEAPTEGNYFTAQPVIQGESYYVWFEFDPIDGNIDDNDFFAKIKIESKNGYNYVVSIYFQTQPGLRWLKTQ